MAKRKAFTLVELLVVLSIIGILIAIMVPGMQLAKQQARYVTCRANMKNIAIAELNYAVNNDDRVVGGWQWISQLPQYYGFDKSGWETDVGHPDYRQWLDDSKGVWTCPAAFKKFKPDLWTSEVDSVEFLDTRTVAVNRNLSWNNDPPAGNIFKFNQPKQSSLCSMFFCVGYFVERDAVVPGWHKFQRYYAFNDPVPYYFPLFPHFGRNYEERLPGNIKTRTFTDGKLNTAYFDGHVDGLDFADYPHYTMGTSEWITTQSLALFWFGH